MEMPGRTGSTFYVYYCMYACLTLIEVISCWPCSMMRDAMRCGTKISPSFLSKYKTVVICGPPLSLLFLSNWRLKQSGVGAGRVDCMFSCFVLRLKMKILIVGWCMCSNHFEPTISLILWKSYKCYGHVWLAALLFILRWMYSTILCYKSK